MDGVPCSPTIKSLANDESVPFSVRAVKPGLKSGDPDVNDSPTPSLLTNRAWLIVGMSRSAWFKARIQGLNLRPVEVPGNSRPYWRVSDLQKWVAELVTARTALPRQRSAS